MNKVYREIIKLIKDEFRVIFIQVNLVNLKSKFINNLTIKYMNNKLILKV